MCFDQKLLTLDNNFSDVMNKSFNLLLLFILLTSCTENAKINRFPITARYSEINSWIDTLNALAVGNDRFYFVVDVTGLQTFPDYYSKGNQLGTLSNWGVPDKTTSSGCHRNQQRFQLGMIGLVILKNDGSEISISDIEEPVQMLNLWTGKIDSKFTVQGIPIHLELYCHPDFDLISVKVRSELMKMKRLKIKISFPQPISSQRNYNSRDLAATEVLSDTNNMAIFKRRNDNQIYNLIIWKNSAELKLVSEYLYYLVPDVRDSVYSFSCQFLNDTGTGRIQNFNETEAASKKSWKKFWSSVGVRDSSEIKNNKTEDDLYLAKYFMRIQGR
jgi:protein-glucosylgalactosylhydroxylysine glucosidase